MGSPLWSYNNTFLWLLIRIIIAFYNGPSSCRPPGYSNWVRKLTGKPVGATPPDCELKARRIHRAFYETEPLVMAAASKTLRIHSDLLYGDLAIAARICFASCGVTLAA